MVVMANRPGDSNSISKNVDSIYSEFTIFQKNLKKLLVLFKDQHKLMKSLNDRRFNVSRFSSGVLSMLRL